MDLSNSERGAYIFLSYITQSDKFLCNPLKYMTAEFHGGFTSLGVTLLKCLRRVS